MIKYKTIYADPPWEETLSGKYNRKKDNKRRQNLLYPTMTLEEIKSLPINNFSDIGCHLWLWTTNQFLRQGFEVMESWGFKYLAPITWIRPSGTGNYFVHRTQTLLFGYKDKCLFNKARYKPNILFANIPRKHSEKPVEMRKLIEEISEIPMLELFARQKFDNWDSWGDEIESDIEFIK